MKWLVFPLLLVLVFANPALAQGNSQGKSKKHGKHQQEESESITETIGDVILGEEDEGRKGKNNNKPDNEGGIIEGVKDVTFGPDERDTIGGYYSKNRVNVDTLPPGIAKNLERGKPLPHGIAKKNLPTNLQSQLPDIFGHRRIVTGEDVVLINEETDMVVDILRGVLTR